jgi:hypothetical protein
MVCLSYSGKPSRYHPRKEEKEFIRAAHKMDKTTR